MMSSVQETLTSLLYMKDPPFPRSSRVTRGGWVVKKLRGCISTCCRRWDTWIIPFHVGSDMPAPSFHTVLNCFSADSAGTRKFLCIDSTPSSPQRNSLLMSWVPWANFWSSIYVTHHYSIRTWAWENSTFSQVVMSSIGIFHVRLHGRKIVFQAPLTIDFPGLWPRPRRAKATTDTVRYPVRLMESKDKYKTHGRIQSISLRTENCNSSEFVLTLRVRFAAYQFMHRIKQWHKWLIQI